MWHKNNFFVLVTRNFINGHETDLSTILRKCLKIHTNITIKMEKSIHIYIHIFIFCYHDIGVPSSNVVFMH